MARRVDGLIGGLAAGLTSMAFFTLVGVAWLHETTCEQFFAQPTRLIPALRGAPPSVLLTVLGAALYLALAALLGLIYGLLARRWPSTGIPATAILWGLGYGLAVWLLVNDVLIPAVGALSYQALWEGLVGCLVAYGLVLAFWVAVAARRAAATAVPDLPVLAPAP